MIEAYQQRFVALEVFYLGWRYHGFASQCETEGTVEVCCMLSHRLIRVVLSNLWKALVPIWRLQQQTCTNLSSPQTGHSCK